MSSVKISDLVEISAEDLDDADILPIVDESEELDANKTKKVSISTLKGKVGTSIPEIQTDPADEIQSNRFRANGEVLSFGLTSANALVVGFDYRESGESEWTRTNLSSMTSLGSFNLTITGLAQLTEYEFRAVAADELNPGVEALGEINSATTIEEAADFISSPDPVPDIGDSHEGGFFAGAIWDQLTTSSSSVSIGTGEKTFTIPENQAATPIFYDGQLVRVVSRADPGEREMRGTIIGAAGTQITVDVDSVEGSGTFSDWSVLVRWRLIVSPKAQGEFTAAYADDSSTPVSTDARVLVGGQHGTQVLVNDGDATRYPAAHTANNLEINSFEDWYIPARDELEIIYRNLKPTTDNNSTGNITQPDWRTSAELRGEIPDADTVVHGTNNHSEPPNPANTASVPGQTSVTDFQDGNAEAFNNVFYGCITPTFASSQERLVVYSFQEGRASHNSSTGTSQIYRVIRRVLD